MLALLNSPLGFPSKWALRICRRRRWRLHSCRPRQTGQCRSVDIPNRRRSRRTDPHSKSSIDLESIFGNISVESKIESVQKSITEIHREANGAASTRDSAKSSEDNGRGHRITGRRNGDKRRRSRNLPHGAALRRSNAAEERQARKTATAADANSCDVDAVLTATDACKQPDRLTNGHLWERQTWQMSTRLPNSKRGGRVGFRGRANGGGGAGGGSKWRRRGVGDERGILGVPVPGAG